MSIKTSYLLLPIFLVSFFLSTNISFAAQPTVTIPQANIKEEQFEGVISKVQKQETRTTFGQKHIYQRLQVQVSSGKNTGKKVVVEQGLFPIVGSPVYKEDDKVVIHSLTDSEGKTQYTILDYVRRESLYWLFGLFVLVVAAVGRKKGLQSFLGLAFSFFLIFKFILSQILAGHSPVIVALIGGGLCVPVTFYLSHGFTKKTHVAVAGTMVSLIITSLLAVFFITKANITGYASEDVAFLQGAIKSLVDMKGIFMAGIIIGLLGILDDVTVSQASIVYQLREVAPHLPFKELYFRAMDVGKDHISSLINTLILVYTGSALPFLLLFLANNQNFYSALNMEIIAEQIIEMLVSSIGLILAVPITTFIAAAWRK